MARQEHEILERAVHGVSEQAVQYAGSNGPFQVGHRAWTSRLRSGTIALPISSG